MDSPASRLGYFLVNQEVIISNLEKELGYGNATISKIISRNSSIKADMLEKLVSKFPNLSKEWLLTGKGEMLNSETIKAEDPLNLLNRSQLIWEVMQTRKEIAEVLKDNNASLQTIIDLYKKIDELKDQLGRKQG